MMVMMIAITPSLNASSRPFPSPDPQAAASGEELRGHPSFAALLQLRDNCFNVLHMGGRLGLLAHRAAAVEPEGKRPGSAHPPPAHHFDDAQIRIEVLA